MNDDDISFDDSILLTRVEAPPAPVRFSSPWPWIKAVGIATAFWMGLLIWLGWYLGDV